MKEKLTKTKKIIVGIIAVIFGSVGFGLGCLLVLSEYYRLNLKPAGIWVALLILGGMTIIFMTCLLYTSRCV